MSYWFTGAAIILSAATSAYSASASATAQKNQADYQAKINENNAKIAAWQRSSALQEGDEKAQAAMQEQSQLLSRQRASLAANGVDLTQGSATDLLASTKFLGAKDVNTIQSNAAREAWGYSVDQNNSLAESNMNKWQAETASPGKQAAIAGGTTLLSGALSFAGAGTKTGSSVSMKYKGSATGGWPKQ